MSFDLSVVVPAGVTLDRQALADQFLSITERFELEPVLGFGAAFEELKASAAKMGIDLPNPEDGEEWEFAAIELSGHDEGVLEAFYAALVAFCRQHALRLHDPQLGEDVDLESPGVHPPGYEGLDEDDDDDENDADLLQPPQDVARRALALLAVVERVYQSPADGLGRWVRDHGVDAYFAPAERAFFFTQEPARADRIKFSWRAESLAVLLWSLGVVDQLPSFTTRVELARIDALANMYVDPQAFIDGATLRSVDDLYFLDGEMGVPHWRARDARFRGRPPPPGIDEGILQERRYATVWLTQPGASWEEISVDT
ncbi:MAG: DUF4272 domain-containing protein [Pseudomonadota bacterium]